MPSSRTNSAIVLPPLVRISCLTKVSDDLLCGVMLSRHAIPLLVSQILTLKMEQFYGGRSVVALAVLDSAAHVFATAQRRLDFPMTIGALGDLHHLAIGQAEIVVLKRCVAVTAGCVDGHVALVTRVGSHRLSPLFDQWSDKRCATIASVNIRNVRQLIKTGIIVEPQSPTLRLLRGHL